MQTLVPYIANKAHYPVVSQEVKDRARQTGVMPCPKCNKVMRLFTTPANQHNEMYCDSCHTSIPLYNL